MNLTSWRTGGKPPVLLLFNAYFTIIDKRNPPSAFQFSPYVPINAFYRYEPECFPFFEYGISVFFPAFLFDRFRNGRICSFIRLWSPGTRPQIAGFFYGVAFICFKCQVNALHLGADRSAECVHSVADAKTVPQVFRIAVVWCNAPCTSLFVA